MPTLSQTTKETKLIIKWGIIGIALIALIFLGIKAGGFLKEVFFPTPPPAPTVSFGKLPKIGFLENKEIGNYSYSIDTLTGKLPVFPDRATVFKTKEQKSDLLAFEKSKERAQKLGFEQSPQTLSDGVYRWIDQSKIERKLTLTALEPKLILDSNFYTDEYILKGENLPSENEAISIAKDMLNSISMLPESVDEEKTTTTLFTIKNYALIPATSFAGSQVIQVNFFQKDIDEKSVFYKSPYTPNISIYITGGERRWQIVKVEYYYQELSESLATYPIKTAEEAFEELKNGKAFYASIPIEKNDINIKEVNLAYYIPDESTKYIMPVIVFEGDEGFFAYISAIKDEWIDN